MADFDKYFIRKQALADAIRIVEGVARNDSHVILLSDYEVVNLREAINACGYAHVADPSPLNVLNNGDWIGQIYQKLPYVEGIKPNATSAELAQRARKWPNG